MSHKLTEDQRREADDLVDGMMDGDLEGYAYEIVALHARVEVLEGALRDIDRWDTDCASCTRVDWCAVSASMANHARAALAGGGKEGGDG